MYTVVQTGGKQYRVAVGSVIQIEQLPFLKDHPLELKGFCVVGGEDGEQVVVMRPATVIAKPLGILRTKKIIVFKKKRRHNYRRKKGHRQSLLSIQIEQVVVNTG